jgi:hypothetical protein
MTGLVVSFGSGPDRPPAWYLCPKHGWIQVQAGQVRAGQPPCPSCAAVAKKSA